MKSDDIEQIVSALTDNLASAREARVQGVIPLVPGLYAWWMHPGQLPGVGGPRHARRELELLYVGIAPSSSTSKATVGSRIRTQHLGGNIGSSTFRKSLTALLVEQTGWVPDLSGSRPQLTPADNLGLSAWQDQNLMVGWAEHPSPRDVEAQVIARMQAPLNLADNEGNALGIRLSELRKSLGRPTPGA